MKKYLFQIFAICFLSFSFTTSYAQCEDCYTQALDFISQLPANSGDCSNVEVASDKLARAIDQFNASTPGNRDYQGYVLMNKLINLLTHINDCGGGCESATCAEFTAQANSMVECLERCGSTYEDDLCKTAAYIRCQCDCGCENPADASCDDPVTGDCCDEYSIDWEHAISACCAFIFTPSGPAHCPKPRIGLVRSGQCASPFTTQEFLDDGRVRVEVCIDEGAECDDPDDYFIQVELFAPCNNVVSERIDVSGCVF